MENTKYPKITQHGFSTLYEYEDGRKVVESNDHKVTTYPDGTIEADLGGGHKTVMTPDGNTNITFNFSAIKRVYPINIFNVTSIDTQTNGELTIKEITFINGGKLYVGYDKTGAVVNISAINVGAFTSNKDGTEVGFDIGTKPSES